jgi:hypothetical protein
LALLSAIHTPVSNQLIVAGLVLLLLQPIPDDRPTSTPLVTGSCTNGGVCSVEIEGRRSTIEKVLQVAGEASFDQGS